MASGVYSIQSPSGKRYIGGSIKIDKRWREHRHALRQGTHVNQALQNAWDKYGGDHLRFSILIICGSDDVLLYEQSAIDAFAPAYNVLQVAGRSIGWKHSDVTKAGFTASRTGVKLGPMSEAHKLKISQAQIGKPRKPLSDAHRARLSQFNKDRMKDQAVRDHLSALNRGKVLSEDHKRKIGVANSRRAAERSLGDS